jgi:hypothetical protein
VKYLKLDKSYDLFISMTWSGDTNHGVSGHLYEIIEYYLLLKSHFKIGILICEDLPWNVIEKCINSKYNLSQDEVKNIKANIIFANRPKYVVGKNILFVDGGFTRTMLRYGVTLLFENIFSFRCSNMDYHYNLPYKNITLLQDDRVYNDEDNKISINYKKKIKFDIFKDIKKPSVDAALLYITSNCRKICDDYLIDLIMQFKFDRYVVLSNDNEKYKEKFKLFKNIDFLTMPVDNIFEKFNTYIYTPTKDRFDCSPRFIAECNFYNKDVIYHNIDNDYLKIDTGLKYRKYDIQNDFKSILLQHNDDIIKIIKNNI